MGLKMQEAARTTSTSWPLRTGAFCGTLAILLGFAVLTGWIAHSPLLIQIAPHLPSMPLNVAINFVLSGVALLGLVTARGRLILICCGLVEMVAGLSLVGYLLRSSFGIDELPSVAFVNAHLWQLDRMAPTPAICFIILATALLLSQTILRHKAAPLLGIAGLLVLGVGATCWVSVLAGASDIPGWGSLTRMAIHTAFGLMALGSGFTAVAWEMSRPAMSQPQWIAIGGGLIIAIFRVGVWWAYAILHHPTEDFLFTLALLGALTSAVVFGVFAHLASKTYFQREALRRVNQRLEEEIAERKIAEEAARAANRAKSEFLANMSHEIRTPMTGVLGMIDLLRFSELSAQQNEHLEMARSSADSLLTLLNDILDLSKIEAGRLELAPVAFSIRRSVAEAVRMFEVSARAKALSLTTHVDANVPDALFGDPLRLRQVLVNLVGNAVKFTAHGRISVHVGLETEDASETVILVRVSDTGVGIPAEKLQLIFDPFRQADGSTARRYGGVGLGLTISSRLVELMGGKIRVESEAGKGSTFSFTARVSHAAPEATAQLAQASSGAPAPGRAGSLQRRLRVLLAEDTVVNQKLVAELLKKDGHEVVVVGNGGEAAAAAAANQFDLVLMDVQMPVMDGFEATTAIRQAENGGARRTPIVAMTAHAMKGDEQKCIQAGMDDYLSKPIHFTELRDMLEKWAPSQPTPLLPVRQMSHHR